MSRNRLILLGIVASLLIAGVASSYASGSPDGLEYVAEQTGILRAAEDSASAGSPMAGYRTDGVADARLSGGIAGVTGVLIVLVLAGGLARLLRRRPTDRSS